MNVTLARALKEKNRIAGKLHKAQELVKKENRKAAGSPRSVDVAATLAEAERLSALLAFIGSVNTDDEVEVERDYRGTVERRWDVAVRQPELLAKTAALQERADALQDKLDEYNAATRVDLPDLK